MLNVSDFAVPILSNHDGLIFDVRSKEHLPIFLDELKAAIDNLPDLVREVLDIELSVPIKFSAEVGKNLFEMEKIQL